MRGRQPVQATARSPIVTFVVGRLEAFVVVTDAVVDNEFWHSVVGGDPKVSVEEESLFTPLGDGECKLSRVIRHHLFDAVNLHF